MSQEMEGKGAKKRQQADLEATRRSDDDSALNDEESKGNKRLKTKSSAIATKKRDPCLLLDFGSEIVRKVLSFLTLKDGLEVRRTCKQLHTNDTAKDVFRYCCILEYNNLKAMSDSRYSLYWRFQTRVLCNLESVGCLRAVLQNETLTSDWVRNYIWDMVDHSNTDSREAISILLQDERCDVDEFQLRMALQKDFTNMAAVLQEDERIKKDILMCPTCVRNISCYGCTNMGQCISSTDGDDGARFCRPCGRKEKRRCKECSGYLCTACFEAKHFFSCDMCGDIYCFHGECKSQCTLCTGCNRRLCISCFQVDAESWYRSLEFGEDLCCPKCQEGKNDFGCTEEFAC